MFYFGSFVLASSLGDTSTTMGLLAKHSVSVSQDQQKRKALNQIGWV
jgi:hypothetical protein